MKKITTIWLFGLLVFMLPVIAFLLLGWYDHKFKTLPVSGRIEHTYVLKNQDNQEIAFPNTVQKITIVNFFFTHCPSICPKMTKNLLQVQKLFGKTTNLQFISFTVDPEHDSPVVLKNFARRYGIGEMNWTLLTGDKKTIYRLARNDFKIVATDGDGGTADFIHSSKLILLDANKRIRGYYEGTDKKEVSKLINDIKKLYNENN